MLRTEFMRDLAPQADLPRQVCAAYGVGTAQSMKKRVLIVEDDRALAKVLRDNLVSEGYEVDHVADGSLAIPRVRTFLPDLVILDVMLPGINGLELCARLRSQSQTPVMMLTVRSGNSDKVVGLDHGADDYVTKPFDLREVLARIRAVLRRSLVDRDTLQLGSLTINFVQRWAVRGGTDLHLTEREFDLLQYLSERPGHVVHRDELLQKFWGSNASLTRSIDIAIARLRKKIEPDVHHPRFIHTVHGDGYTWTAKEDE
jgi:two-component system, OmpR family, response regulator MtrA